MPQPLRNRAAARLAAVAALVAMMMLVFVAGASGANSCVWTGATDSNWATASNWSFCGGLVPGASDDVSIPSSAHNPVVTTTQSANSVTLTGTPTVSVTGGSLTVANQIAVPALAKVAMSSGAVSGSLQVGDTAGLSITGGSLSGTLSATTPTTLSIAPTDFGSTGLTLGTDVTVQQTADVTMTGGTLAIGSDTYQLTNNASLLAGSGTITIGSSGRLQKLGGLFESTVQPHIISSGTIQDSSDSTVSGGGDLQLQPTVAADELAGTVTADSQSVVFGNGNYQIDSPGLTLGDSGSYSTSGSSHIDLNGQTLSIGSSGYQMESGSSITGSGTVAGTGFLALNTTGISIAPGIGHTMSIAGEVLQASSEDFSTAGTIQISGKWFTFDNLTDSGGTTLDVVAGGLFRHVGGTATTISVPITDAGTVEQYTPSSRNLTIDNLAVTATGTVIAGSHELDIHTLTNLAGGTLTNGAYIVSNGAKLGVPGPLTHLAANLEVDGTGSVVQTVGGAPAVGGLSVGSTGTLSGTGTIPGDVVNAGSVSPGGSSTPGTLGIGGNYTQTAGGTLRARVTGTAAGEFDVLSVAHNIALDGALNLAPDPSYASSAAIGDHLGILTFSGTRGGAFAATAASPPLAGGKTFGAIYDDVHGHVNATVGRPPSNTAPPVISGTARQGQLLSATNGSWSNSPTSFRYAWQDCNAAGSSCSAIAGAAASTHVLSTADVGHTLRVVVTATSPYGSTASTSQKSAMVAPPPPPAMSGVHLRSSAFRAKKGSSLALTLSEPATVAVVITGRVAARKVHGHCKVDAKKGKRCTVAAKRLKLTLHGLSGANVFPFRVLSLKPGKYKATLTARGSGGRTSPPFVLHFTIKAPAK